MPRTPKRPCTEPRMTSKTSPLYKKKKTQIRDRHAIFHKRAEVPKEGREPLTRRPPIKRAAACEKRLVATGGLCKHTLGPQPVNCNRVFVFFWGSSTVSRIVGKGVPICLWFFCVSWTFLVTC